MRGLKPLKIKSDFLVQYSTDDARIFLMTEAASSYVIKNYSYGKEFHRQGSFTISINIYERCFIENIERAGLKTILCED